MKIYQMFGLTNRSGPLFGVEVEVEGTVPRGSQRDYVDPFWRVEGDGSLRGTAFEAVSKPMKYRHILPAMRGLRAVCTGAYQSGRAGTHLHLNASDLEKSDAFCLAVTASLLAPAFLELEPEYRQDSFYAKAGVGSIYHALSVLRGRRSGLKYRAFNLDPLSTFGTIEYRGMESTLSTTKVMERARQLALLRGLAVNHTPEAILSMPEQVANKLGLNPETVSKEFSLGAKLLPKYREAANLEVIL